MNPMNTTTTPKGTTTMTTTTDRKTAQLIAKIEVSYRTAEYYDRSVEGAEEASLTEIATEMQKRADEWHEECDHLLEQLAQLRNITLHEALGLFMRTAYGLGN